ncbi:MAG: hypothetical protein QXH55_05895 [Candidatus Korarchaeota archaeon]|nr:hypothetical protein [Thermoproteota archaeon]MCR8463687.1 hypothetical protein [Thermoproteota archaeon]
MGVKNIIAIIVVAAVALIVGYYISFITQEARLRELENTLKEVEEDIAWRNARITISGSTTVLPIANASAISMMNKYPGITITVQGVALELDTVIS